MTTNPLAFKTTMIRATSRASVKIRDSFYTFESTEERSINHELLPKDQNEACFCHIKQSFPLMMI